jgi:hypothetical protein
VVDGVVGGSEVLVVDGCVGTATLLSLSGRRCGEERDEPDDPQRQRDTRDPRAAVTIPVPPRALRPAIESAAALPARGDDRARTAR